MTNNRRRSGSNPQTRPAHPLAHRIRDRRGHHGLTRHPDAPAPRRLPMKKPVALVGRITATAIVLGSVATLTWWDLGQEPETLIAGTSSPELTHIQIADARTNLACPGPPALASLGDVDASDDGEAPTGTFDPEYAPDTGRSEEHTSELQSRGHLVCRLLLEKKKQNLTQT